VGLAWVAAHDGAYALALKYDQGAGEIVGRIGYWLGNGVILIPLLAVVWILGWRLRKPILKTAGSQALLAFILSGILGQIVKHLIGRPRPREWAAGVSHFGPSLSGGLDSFPSGHTTTAMAAALVLSYHYPKGTPLFMGGAAFVATARVIGGSHFPGDVMGGIALGLAVAWVIIVRGRKRKQISAQLEEDS